MFAISIGAENAVLFGREGFDYVSLPSGEEYIVNLHNNHRTRCDVELYIDEEHVGGFVVQAHQTERIERPENEKRKFTFFDENSEVAESAGVRPGDFKNGLIRAIFKPKKQPVCSSCGRNTPASYVRSSKYGSGVTVLGNKSYQTLTNVPSLKDSEIDWNLAAEVSLRLVSAQQKFIPLSRRSYPPRIEQLSFND